MKNLLTVVKWAAPALCIFTLVAATGCGESRPDPRANPDFNEEAYNDPNEAMKSMQVSDAKPK